MPDESDFKERLLDRLKAIGAGLISFAPGALASDLLARVLTGKGGGAEPPFIKAQKAVDLPEKAFGKNKTTKEMLFSIEPGAGASSGREIRLHSDEKGKVSLPAAAHEIGHSMGGPIQKVTGLAEHLFFRPRMDGRALPLTVSPLHLPLLAAATSPVKEDEKTIWSVIKRNPALIAALMSAVPLIGEAHASARGLYAINKVHGSLKALRSAGPMARNFAATAASHLPAIIALYAASKIRNWLQKKDDSAPVEKRAQAVRTGRVSRVVDRPLLGGERIPPRPEESLFPVDPSYPGKSKKWKLKPDEDRNVIQPRNTQTGSLGIQE